MLHSSGANPPLVRELSSTHNCLWKHEQKGSTSSSSGSTSCMKHIVEPGKLQPYHHLGTEVGGVGMGMLSGIQPAREGLQCHQSHKQGSEQFGSLLMLLLCSMHEMPPTRGLRSSIQGLTLL